MEIAHVSLPAAHPGINNGKRGAEDAGHIAPALGYRVLEGYSWNLLKQGKYFSAVAVPPIYHLQD